MSEREFDCHFCGGEVIRQRVDVMRRWKGRYVLIENVPAHVCTQCGERYYDAVVAEAMGRIMRASEAELGAAREKSAFRSSRCPRCMPPRSKREPPSAMSQ